MSVSYRDRFSNYLQEHRNAYAPIGSIFPVSVDSFSAPEDRNGAGSGFQTPEYGYRDFLYCDGEELLIRDYPQLYSTIRNTYGGFPRVNITTNGVAGSIRRTYWINGKMFINFYKDDDVDANDKRPYPYGLLFRFVDDTGDSPPGPGLGSLPSTIFEYDTIYGTQYPTEDTSGNTPAGEFAFEIVFPETVDVGNLPQTATNVVSGTHPNVIISKSFNLRDTPYQIGTFNLPDYRDRVIVGLGGVDGDGSPTVENALINQVGQTGGTWYIDKNTLLDGGLFFSVGDVKTKGYTDITADVFTYLTGDVTYRVGPIDDHIFNRPAEHFHNILGSEADELTNSEFAATPVDVFASMYSTSRANITAFSPAGGGGLPLGHSHGLTKEPLNDPSSATYGNTAGIGGYDPNTPADIYWDVNSIELTSYLNPLNDGSGRIGYDDVSVEPHGPGTGEWEGFEKPSIAQGNKYLAFGYGASATGFDNPDELKTTRRVEYKLDFTGYTQLYVYAIAGNDNNGGERPNNPGEGLYCEFSNGESIRLFPSVQDFINENEVGNSEGFDLYDAIHSQWKEFVIDIPAALQDQPDQVIVLRQDLSAGSEQSNVPAGNLNANDMIGVQGIGLRGGIEQPAVNEPGVYPITGSQFFEISTAEYNSAASTVKFTLSEQHTFDVGQYVSIGGVNPAGFNGDYEVVEVDSPEEFTVSVDSAKPATGSGGVAALALGTFVENEITPAPRLYVVDAATVIGQKVTTVTVPGTGVLFQEEILNQTSGTISMSPVSSTAGTVTKIEVDLYGTGGGGANSTTDGTDGGYSYVSFEIDGEPFTVYAYGGTGGTDGNAGGAKGTGGTVGIPAALLSAPYSDIVEIVTQDAGGDGENGGGDGPGSTSGGASLYGAGGDGTYETFQQNVSGSWTKYTSNGSFNAGTPGNSVVNRTIQVRAAGGGGGGGNGNANSGCEGSGATGGAGGGGALVTATVGQNSFSWVIGQGGGAGFNNVDGFVDGTGTEAGPSSGGQGAAGGGNGARGAWGNGATAGAGGGATGVYADNGNAMFGAGGGGGGGGSGGGFNGGGTTDGCYAGGNNRSATTGLQQVSNALGFANGANGTQGGCTAGGGGGGGGSAGPSGSASGGDGGQAGVGHNGNGGGTGGRRGDSAWRSSFVSGATIGVANNGGSPGSAGGSGYVEVKVDEVQEFAGKVGGSGGGGAHVFLIIKNRNIAITAGLQSPGGGPSAGGGGYVKVQYRGTEGGEDVDSTPTTPAGRYYECDSSGVPAGSAFNDAVWKQSSANGDLQDNNTRPVSPGTGTGSNGGFVMPTSANGAPPKYGNRSTKYLPFSGPGTREYVMGPMDLRKVNKIKFSVAKGTNNNGGETPDEDLMVYYRAEGGTTTTLLNAIVTSSQSLTGWEEFEINVPENSNARNNDMELLFRQTRPASQDDNASATVDNYGISAVTFFYDSYIEKTFVPSDGNTISDVDYVDDTVTAISSGIVVTEGSFEMSSSTPISTTALVSPESNIPLITRYHRAKYMIKAR